MKNAPSHGLGVADVVKMRPAASLDETTNNVVVFHIFAKNEESDAKRALNDLTSVVGQRQHAFVCSSAVLPCTPICVESGSCRYLT